MMLALRLLARYTKRGQKKCPKFIRIQIVGYQAASRPLKQTHHAHQTDIRIQKAPHVHSKVIYPNKHVNSIKSLSSSQMQLYRESIDRVQAYLRNNQIASNAAIDLRVVLGLHSELDGIQLSEKQLRELTRWLHKMPNIHITPSVSDDISISKDYHIESVDFVSNHYPMITWKNQLCFATHCKDMFHAENTVNRIKELLRYYQLHSVFSKHSVESKMIISRGLNSELTTAYNHLLNGRIDKLRMNDYHHLLGK